MIQALEPYSHHTLVGIVTEGIPTLISSLKASVSKVALNIILHIGVSFCLFYLHHNLFTLGFVVGFIFDKQVQALVEKVNVVYNAQRTFLEKSLFYAGGGFLALWTIPTSLTIIALYYSTQWGALLYQSSLKRYPQPNIDIEQDLVDDSQEIQLDQSFAPELDAELEDVAIEINDRQEN